MRAIESLIEDVSIHFPVLEEWYVDSMLRLSAQPVADACQLLLAASHFGVTNYGIRRALEQLEKTNDPPERQRRNIVNSYLRQVVLMRFDLAREERRKWFAYWIDEKNLSGEGVVTVAYIVNLAAESQELLTPAAKKYVANWHIRHNDLRAPKSRAWAPRALSLCGHRRLARRRAEELLIAREKNGSWPGGYNTTAAIAYALVHSGEVVTDEIADTIRYLLRRLERGVTADVALESTTLRLLKLSDLLNTTQENGLIRAVRRVSSVFISHSSEDHPFVRNLGKALNQQGLRVWIDEAEITGGDSFLEKLEEGLADMQHLVVVLSRASVESFWVKRELNYALVDKVKGSKGKVIPVLLEDCEIPPLLRERHYVDFRGDFHDGLRGLLRAINVE